MQTDSKRKIEIIIAVILIIGALVWGVFMVMMPIINKSGTKQIDIIEYLNNKYGNGDWKITEVKDLQRKNHEEVLFRSEYTSDGERYKVSSSYLGNQTFNIHTFYGRIYEDGFLPTYYSTKYNLTFELNTLIKAEHTTNDSFPDFYKRIKYIIDYHYPYTKNNGYVSEFNIQQFFLADNLPDFHHLPELDEIVYHIEQKYFKNGIRNSDKNDQELYKLVFEEKANEDVIVKYISNHITKVDGHEIYYTYKNKTENSKKE